MDEFRYDLSRSQGERGNEEGLQWFRIYTTWTEVRPYEDDNDPPAAVDQWCQAKYCVRNHEAQSWIESPIIDKLWDPHLASKPKPGSLVRAHFNPANSHWELLPPPSTKLMAITVEDSDATPTYPIQGINGGNVFPIAFVDPGYLKEAGRQDGNFSYTATPDAFVFVVSRNWAPKLTLMSVWWQRGINSDFPGEWWTDWRDEIRYGRTQEEIDEEDAGNVKEWYSANYANETVTERTWYCRNRVGPVIDSNTWVAFHQRGSVAYILNGKCEPETYSS